MNKIFYKQIDTEREVEGEIVIDTTFEIKGMSDGAVTMEFPYLETEIQSAIPFDVFKVVLEEGEPVLKVKTAFTDEEWDKIIKQ